MHSGNVGARLQQLRRGGGLSVRTLAAQSGLSPRLLSQVERGLVTPSLESLVRLTRSLGISLGTFFAALESSPPRVVRASTRPPLLSPWARVTVEALDPLPGAGMREPLMLTLASGGRSEHAPVALGACPVCPPGGGGGRPDAGRRGARPPPRRCDHVFPRPWV